VRRPAACPIARELRVLVESPCARRGGHGASMHSHREAAIAPARHRGQATSVLAHRWQLPQQLAQRGEHLLHREEGGLPLPNASAVQRGVCQLGGARAARRAGRASPAERGDRLAHPAAVQHLPREVAERVVDLGLRA
jgi:hypothetical protein